MSLNSAPSTLDLDRAEKLREAIEALNEANELVPVIVEGKRDAAALRSLGLEGDIITLHAGRTIHDFCEDVLERYDRVMLLLDWDAKGDALLTALQSGLKGRWEEFSPFRNTIRNLCQKDIKDIEGIPKLLKRLEGPEGPFRQDIDNLSGLIKR